VPVVGSNAWKVEIEVVEADIAELRVDHKRAKKNDWD